MLRFIAIVLAVAVAAPATSTAQDTPQINLISLPTQGDYIVAPPAPNDVLAKFPHEDRAEVAVLEYANALVNENIEYMDDLTHYGKDDLWVMDPSDHRGDCEDYALTKFSALSRAGYPALAQARILSAVVEDNGRFYGHAVLEVRMTHGTVAILDSRYDHLMTKKELTKREHYRLFDWK